MGRTRRWSLAVVGASTVGLGIVTACGSESGTAPSPEADAAPPTITSCEATAPECRVGRCVVTASAGGPLGTTVSVKEQPAPAEIATDLLDPTMCQVDVAPGSTASLTLSLEVSAPLSADAMLVRYAAPYARALGASSASGARISGLLRDGGLYGVTARSKPWALEDAISDDPLTSNDLASLVRNVTSQPISAAYWDGTHFFLGSGPRVLVYAGVPKPGDKPAVVLGAPTLNTIASGLSASIFSGVSAIWSNGEKLVVGDGNRALVWNKLPNADFVPADIVLGQHDFTTGTANVGGVSASTLSFPQGIDSDGTRLLIADTRNNRVLVWNAFPTSMGEAASSAIGQASLATSAPGTLYQAWGATLDGAGAYVGSFYTGPLHFATLGTNVSPDFALVPEVGTPAHVSASAVCGATSIARQGSMLLAADSFVPRIAVRRSATAGPSTIDFVLGQPDPARGVLEPTSSSSIAYGAKVIGANGLVIVPDGERVLVYDAAPAYSFEPATRVVGQAGFTANDKNTDYRRISSKTLAYPADVAVHGGMVAVADRANNRVLLYPKAGLAPANSGAPIVLGQPDDKSFVPNVDQLSASASTMSGPSGVALDDNHLVVADTENHRVLVWSPIPTSSNTPATYVLGQDDFAGHRPNRGRGDANLDGYGDADADGMFAPTGVASDGTHLFIADRINNRVLVYDDLAAVANGKSADRVLGQADFTSVLPNRGNGGDAFHPRVDGLNLPMGLALDGTSLWVADTENNRLVRYDHATTTAVPGAVVGQPDGTTLSNPNNYVSGANVGYPITAATTASSVIHPRGVAVAGSTLYVSELDSNRVHVFTHDAGADTYAPAGRIGQPFDTSSIANAGGIGAGSLSAPQGLAVDGARLFVADSANHRVLRFDAPTAATPTASVVIGQSSFVANGFDQTAPTTAGAASRPHGMWLSDGDLFVAETSLHRVVVRELPLASGKAPKRILGQIDGSAALPNAGGAVSASTLLEPHGVFADATRILVADTGNNRVLVYPRSGATAATLVLGQAGFGLNDPNRGGAASLATLRAPEGVYTDGTKLFVADTGNHRVLVWNAFPTSNGQPADVVLGQADAISVEPNRGLTLASPTALASPAAVLAFDGALYVADSGNNRVVRFDGALANGAPAAAVLGQPDMVSRTPTANPNDEARLAGPVALATDGANLYVSERDTSRVAVFGLGDAPGSKALLLNAYAGLPLSAPAGVAVERTPLFTSRLYVADTNHDRLVVLGSISRLSR